MSGGRRAAAGRPPSLHTRPCLAQSATGSLPRRRGATAHVPYQGAAAASYAPGGQPARHTCHRDPARPARSASTPRGPPRYSAGCRGYPASAARRGRDRAVDRASARSIEVFSAGWRAARLEQEAHSRAWLCPPRRHKHASGPLRRLAATRSARSLPPACVRMAFACSEARGSVVTAVTATRPVAFSGALEASWQGLGAPGLGWF